MKTIARQSRHARVRSRISGTVERPRLVVYRGGKTMSLQLVDDTEERVLLTVTTQAKQPVPVTTSAASELGKRLATEAKTKKIKVVVFDRAGYRYHGNVKAAVEAVRESGIQV